jgi:hypothetical protein
MDRAPPPTNLTDKERRRLRESVQSDDPMLIADAEQAMADAQALIDGGE